MSKETCVEFEVDCDLGSLEELRYFDKISHSVESMSGGVIRPIDPVSIDYFDEYGERFSGKMVLQMTPGCMGVSKPRLYKLAKKELVDFNTMLATAITIIKDIEEKGPVSKGRSIKSFVSMCTYDDGSGERVYNFRAIKDPANRKWSMYCGEAELNWDFNKNTYVLVVTRARQ
jgi:hypothetical protein